MNEFNRGVLFTLCLLGFGKGMYELGRLKERRDNVKAWKRLAKEIEKVCEDLKPEENNKEEEVE